MLTKQDVSPLSPGKKPRVFYGYTVVAAAVGIQAITWGMYSAFGVFFMPLLTEFEWSRATISGAASLSEILVGLGAIALGGLSDRFGPRLLMAACGLVLGLGYLLMWSQLDAVWQLYLFYGLMVGVGLSGTDVMLLSTTARWFVKKRGMMSGIVKIGTGIGMLAVPLVATSLISAHGWRDSYMILGAVTVAVVVLAAQFLRRDPGQMGQLPDGGDEASSSSANSAEAGFSLQQAIHTTQFWVICAAYLTIFFCAGTVLVHLAPHAVDLGFSATVAGSLISTIGATSIVGRLMMPAYCRLRRSYWVVCRLPLRQLIPQIDNGTGCFSTKRVKAVSASLCA